MLMKLGVSALFITSACAACWSESKGNLQNLIDNIIL